MNLREQGSGKWEALEQEKGSGEMIYLYNNFKNKIDI